MYVFFLFSEEVKTMAFEYNQLMAATIDQYTIKTKLGEGAPGATEAQKALIQTTA